MLLNFKVFVLLLITGVFALSAMTGQAVAQTGGGRPGPGTKGENEWLTHILDFETSVDEKIGKKTYRNGQELAIAFSSAIYNNFNDNRIYRFKIKFYNDQGEEIAGSVSWDSFAPGRHRPVLVDFKRTTVPEDADYGQITVSAVLEVKVGKAWIVLDARNQTFKPDGSDGPDDLPGGLGDF